jgi:hypothetical protein
LVGEIVPGENTFEDWKCKKLVDCGLCSYKENTIEKDVKPIETKKKSVKKNETRNKLLDENYENKYMV